MADAKAAAATNGTIPGLRSGMKRIGSVSNAPWWNIKKGAKLYGVLENMFERPDERTPSGKSKFFQIALLEDADVRYGRGETAKLGVAKAGTVVNVNYNPKTKDLEPLIDNILRGAVYNVEIICTGDKMPISKGRTMWPIEVGIEMKKAPMVSDDPDFDGSDDDDDAAAGAATA